MLGPGVITGPVVAMMHGLRGRMAKTGMASNMGTILRLSIVGGSSHAANHALQGTPCPTDPRAQPHRLLLPVRLPTDLLTHRHSAIFNGGEIVMRQSTSAFMRAVATYCEGLELVSPGCHGAECEHADGDSNHSCEEHFSWAQCDSCGSTLGGNRMSASGLYRDDSGALQTIDMEICGDCAMYHANGELPDDWYDN